MEDIDRKLNDDLKRLERETVEVLLSWENKHAGDQNTNTPSPANTLTNDGYLSTLRLIDMLDELGGELEMMEQWLMSKGDALKLMQEDMLEIEAVSSFGLEVIPHDGYDALADKWSWVLYHISSGE